MSQLTSELTEWTHVSTCVNAEITSIQDYKIMTVTFAKLWNHISSVFNLNVTFRVSALVPRGIAELLETSRCHCHRVASNHTTRPSWDEEKSLSKSWTVHHSVRSLAFFPDRARWYDSRGGSRGAHRTMSITVRDFSSRSYCSGLLPLRDFSALEQGRTFADRG